ncbi:MAG TPA: hypothetical protein VEJ88_01820, partial [Dissulfurispiraceae bacterium]|nr:hypothetical protein [Dissulfurispiraceae bacterium]
LFGLGNILAYLTGRGDVTAGWLRENNSTAFYQLTTGDMNIVFKNRVVNLKKIYPYVPEGLNRILLHFSMGADIFYDNTDELLADMQEVKDKIR